MQGQRGGTLPETLDFDHGPTPANANIGQQIFWNSMRNPAEDRLTDLMHMNDAIANPVGQEHQSLGGWHLGESISNGGQHVWSSSTISCVGNGLRLEDNVNLNHQIIRSHNPDAVSQNINLNTRFVDHGTDNFQGTEDTNPFKTSGMENERSSAGVPSPPLDGRRPSCKRKAVEGNIGQSSVSGSSGLFLHPESSNPWPSAPGSYDAGSSSSIPLASQSMMPRLCLGLRGGSSSSNFDAPVTVHPEGSHRNFRLRINPSNENSVPATLSSTGGAVRNLVMPHPHHSIDCYELGSSPAVDATGNQSQPSIIPVPTLLQRRESLRWNESSSAGTGNSLTPISLADTEDANPMSTTRNLLEHPIPPPPVNDLRNLVRSSTSRNLAGGVSGVPSGHVASSSRSGSSSGSYPLTAPSWLVPPPNVSSRSSRRLAEYVRRSLFSSTIAESGGQGDLHTPLHLRPSASSASSSEEPSGASNPVHHRSQPRSAAWMDRQGEGIVGIPFPLRSLTVGSEGRSRHVSEQIRNVLDLMRRGEGLRLEDVMILDQSVLFGMADIHDRHRDMRLDVDNMSYEELLALEERIGIVNTGLSEENIMKLLKQREYSIALRSDEAEPCCVCQEEYIDGENLGTLDCGHNFHPDCIKKWLMLKNWCPICKTKGLAAS